MKKILSVLLVLALALGLFCALAEEPAVIVEQPWLEAEEVCEDVTVTLTKDAEGVWTVADVKMAPAAAEATETTAPIADVVTVAGVCEGEETVVALDAINAIVVETENQVDVTVNAAAVAAAMGNKYTVGDLHATTLTYAEGGVKVAFDIQRATVYVYYVDGVEDEVLFPSLKISAQIGDKTPEYNGIEPVREGFEFNGWNEWNPVVKGETIYEAQWLEYFTVTYFDWYDQKVLAEFTVLEGQPTPTINPDQYTKASYVNMGFTTAIAPTVTGDVTYTMMQMVPPRENNVSGLKFVCTCPNNADHCKEIGYSGTVANYLRLDDISEDVYFDGSNYKCVVYLGSDYTQFTSYYNTRVSSKVKNSHSFISSDTSSFTVTLDMSTKRWVADQSTIVVNYVCATKPVATDKMLNNIKIRVKGTVDGKVKTLGSLKVLDGSYTIGEVNGNAADGWTVNVYITDFEAHVAKWEAKYGVDAVVDTAETGNIVYTFSYTMPKDGLIHTDGSNWTFQAPTNDVKLNGYTIWVTPVE